jgi:hypothetical protein
MILSIIGALPDIIKAVEAIWDWIKQIRDRKTRREMTAKLRKLVLSHLSEDKKAVVNAEGCLSDLATLQEEVLRKLEAESHEMLARIQAGRVKPA